MNGEGSGMLSQPCQEETKAGWVDLGDDRFGISSLTLERYRCFKKLDIKFDPNLTIISAPNGEGKTAILDAVAISLRFFIDTLQKRQSSLGFTKDDIQLVAGADGNMENYLPHEPTKLSAEAWFLGEKVNWTRKLKSMASSAKTITEDGSGLSSIALELLRAIQPDSTINEEKKSCILPMMSYYGTGRLFSQIKASNAKQSGRSRLDGYEDCLNPNSSYKAFLAWYGPMSSEAQAETQSGLIAGHRAQERVKAVSGVIQKVLEPTGWKGIRWDFVNREPKAYHSDGRTFPVRLLSDGVRNMLAMAADMAFRCSQLNPQLGENVANETPGVVLIDEIDMHLHPEWQQSVLSRLMAVFPKIQFLVSTHSPEVISTFKKEHIRVVDHGKVISPCYQTSGVPSDIILANVMGVDPVWGELEAAKWLTRYHALISQGFDKTEESAMLRNKIIEHYGVNSQQILECDQAIRLMLIRNKISSSIAKVS